MTADSHPECPVCDHGGHTCPGCGASVPHPGDAEPVVHEPGCPSLLAADRPTTNKGEPMTLTDPDTQVPATNAPNIVEYVKASEVKPGDRLLVLTTIYTVTAVTPYSLAYAKGHGIEDKVVRTSSPTVDYGRWRVRHIQTNYGGLVRFPHEDIARLANV